MQHQINDLSPLLRAVLARFEGAPLILSVRQAAALAGVSHKAAQQQIYRKKGIFAQLVKEVEGGERFICLGDLVNLTLGQLPQKEEKKKVGRPTNKARAAAVRNGGAAC